MTNSRRVKYSVKNSPTFFMNGDTEVTREQPQRNNRTNGATINSPPINSPPINSPSVNSPPINSPSVNGTPIKKNNNKSSQMNSPSRKKNKNKNNHNSVSSSVSNSPSININSSRSTKNSPSISSNLSTNINLSALTNSSPSKRRNSKTNMNSLLGKTVSASRFFKKKNKSPKKNNSPSANNSSISNNSASASNSASINNSSVSAINKVSNNSLHKFMNKQKKSIDDQLSYLIEGMKRIEDAKLKIIEDLDQYKMKTTRKIIDLENVVKTFYHFLEQLNTILMDDEIDKVQYITEIVTKMKSNKPFIKHLTEVIQQNSTISKNTNNSGSNTNSLNVSNMATKKKNVYTNNSVKSKLGSFTLKKALNSINKML